MKENRTALIMAGGEGTRFWPFSTPDFPKQFLDLFLGRSMLRVTFERINKLIDTENIFVITNYRYGDLTSKELPELPKGNILLEPEKRNTFPAIAYYTYRAAAENPNGSVIVLAADHIIGNEVKFLDTCRRAFTLAEETSGIITFGIMGDRPETNYGYLYPHNYDEVNSIHHGTSIEFIEKPDLETASNYFLKGGYFWNSGIFTFPFRTFMNETSEISPEDHLLLKNYAFDEDNVEELFKSITAESVDYQIMERSNRIKMIQADFEWDDVGNWLALQRMGTDSDNNVLINSSAENCKDSIIVGKGIKIQAKDIYGKIIVINGNKILVSSLKGISGIKKALKGESRDPSDLNITVKGMSQSRVIALDCSDIIIDNKGGRVEVKGLSF